MQRADPYRRRGETTVRTFPGFTLYRRSPLNESDWINYVLRASPPKKGARKRVWYLAHNGERMAEGPDIAILRAHYPDLCGPVLRAIESDAAG